MVLFFIEDEVIDDTLEQGKKNKKTKKIKGNIKVNAD